MGGRQWEGLVGVKSLWIVRPESGGRPVNTPEPEPPASYICDVTVTFDL